MAETVEESVPPKPRKEKTWMLMALLVLVVSGDLAMRVFSYFKAPKVAAAVAAVEVPAPRHESGRRAEAKSTLTLDPFLVNLADPDNVRFMKATFQLGLAGDKEMEELKANAVFIAATRDAIISLLSAKTSDQILSPEGKDKLREEIRTRVNDLLPRSSVNEVFIVDIVVQL